MSSLQHVSRRAVTRGAAWTMPIVAVSVAAPAFAASLGSSPLVTALGGCRCGTGGGPTKPYRLDVTFSNTTGTDFTVSNPTIVVSGVAGGNVTLLPTTPPQTTVVPPGNKVISYRFTRGNNSTSDSVQFGWTATDTATNDSSDGSVTINVAWATCTDACL